MHSRWKSTELRTEFLFSHLSPSLFPPPLHHNPQIKSDKPLKSVPCHRLFFCEIIGEASKEEELSPMLSSVGDREAGNVCVVFCPKIRECSHTGRPADAARFLRSSGSASQLFKPEKTWGARTIPEHFTRVTPHSVSQTTSTHTLSIRQTVSQRSTSKAL